MSDIGNPGLTQKTSHGLLARVAAVVIVTLILLSWLYLRAEAVSTQAHMNYTQQLRVFREADAQVDAEVLAARMELSRNYDALNSYTEKLMSSSDHIDSPPEFLLADDSSKVKNNAASLHEKLKIKIHKVDLFKRNNAILNNSLSYFQKTADDYFDSPETPTILFHLESYVRHMMFFIRIPDQKHGEMLLVAQKELLMMPISPATQQIVDNLTLHGDLIKKYIVMVDKQMREILRLPISHQQERLTLSYSKGYENAQILAQRYRNLLYVIVVLLTTYLAYIFIHLERTRRSLVKAHEEVTERYQAQKVAEKHLQLHATAFESAHEGITLTDAEGNILEVNPAFTRITGYERDEVIGHNPRVLRSGRHDKEFYRAMWKSINDTGNWRGEIWNRNKFGDVYPEILSVTTVHDSQGDVTNYVAVFADISRLKEQESQLREMAYYDALTNLPNRVLLTDRIVHSMSQCRRSNTYMAICYLDLDEFKPINDTFGHEAGDRLLVEIANRFQEGIRGSDTVARLGGDEFILLFPGLEEKEEYERAVQQVMKNIDQPVMINDEPVTISASIGVTLYPHDDSDADTLLRHADQAMYQAKQEGKNRYHLFDLENDGIARSRHEYLSRIKSALKNNELTLYYQPKVDLRQGKVIGVEALIRWQHPERGLLLPMEFIPSIEDHELIVQVGNWVIDTALNQLEQWKSAGLDIPVSVNVASRQLQDPNFMLDLKNALASHSGISPTNLELEVLESTALEDIVSVSRVIEDCQKIGVSFSLDDFGTGYSSLTYLKRLPASGLKIDKSFVRDMLKDSENLAIVQGILGLARAFQKHVVAEGLETMEHGRMLLQLGCDYVQGYGVAKPMPANKIQQWSNNWRPDPAWVLISALHWDSTDYPMLAAGIEHRRWIEILIHSINSAQPVSHKQVANPHHCRFGEWYYGKGRLRYGDIPGFQKIEKPHKRVHATAETIERYCRDGQISQAKELIPELLEQRDEILSELEKLSLAVAQSNGVTLGEE